MPYWAAVRTAPHHERLAYESVGLAGFETFTPKIRTKVGTQWRTVPLFGVYFFVRIIDQWRVLERTLGVLNVVKVGATPSKCPDAEIAALIERSDPDGVIRLATRPSSPSRRVLSPGAQVEIAGGPLRGFSGIYAGMSVQERELVLINILGASRPVEIASGLLAPH
jgi:transcription antitermination factor NusG